MINRCFIRPNGQVMPNQDVSVLNLLNTFCSEERNVNNIKLYKTTLYES